MSFFNQLNFKQEDIVDAQLKLSNNNSEKQIYTKNLNTDNVSINQIDIPENKEIFENYFLCTQDTNNKLIKN